MQNLFSKLSQTLARLSSGTFLSSSSDALDSLESRIVALEIENKKFQIQAERIDLIASEVTAMKTAIGELNAISNILLSVQQQMLEDVAFGGTPVAPKKTTLPVFPLVTASDDDDLPN